MIISMFSKQTLLSQSRCVLVCWVCFRSFLLPVNSLEHRTLDVLRPHGLQKIKKTTLFFLIESIVYYMILNNKI